ncbi:MAG: hypothetical protein AMJ73_05820 [candidate division Zixibacteria bacterium SM1_73]|nr:MAG: hypothetical protein AMJ73_05820 [candidate division Zixibacteria bacterium SM1_73]
MQLAIWIRKPDAHLAACAVSDDDGIDPICHLNTARITFRCAPHGEFTMEVNVTEDSATRSSINRGSPIGPRNRDQPGARLNFWIRNYRNSQPSGGLSKNNIRNGVH